MPLPWLVAQSRATESKVARWWHVCDWPGGRSYGCARNLWGADATGNGAGTHRATESLTFVRCCGLNRANETYPFRQQTRPVDDWRWLHTGCNGPDNGAHAPGLRTVVSRRPPNPFEIVVSATQQRFSAE